MSQSFTVRAPVGSASGIHAGVEFTDGVAVVDESTHRSALRYFRKAGYEVAPVVDVDDPTPTPPAPVPVVELAVRRPNRAASKAEWVAYAIAVGGDPAAVEALTRRQIIDDYGA